MKLEFDKVEILEWETEVDNKVFQKFYYKEKTHKNPRLEKLKDYRKTDKYFHFGKESTYVKRLCRREYRSKTKSLIKQGKYDKITKPVKTQGWLTW